jgi:hypothetical protein
MRRRSALSGLIASLGSIGSARALTPMQQAVLLSASSGPSLDLNFINGSPIDSRIAFTRASPGTYFDVTGTLQTAASNVPRIGYDPVSHLIQGLLIEEQRTNLLLNSATLATQSVTGLTATAYTLSFYGTGSVAMSGVFSGTLAGTGAFPARVTQTFTPTAGALTLTVTGSVLDAQLEAGAFVTSFIPSTASAATRAQDVATMPVGGWFNAAAGTLVADFMVQTIVVNAVVIAPQTDGNNGLNLRFGGASPTTMNMTGFNAGSNVGGPVSTNTLTSGQQSRAGFTYNGLATSIALNGITPTTATLASAPSITTISFGVGRNAIILNGYLRRVRYWPRALSNTQLQQVTT